MLGLDIIVVTLGACCGWLTPAAEALMPTRSQAVNEVLMQPMKGRTVAVENGRAFSEAGMTDPADRIADGLATSLAQRYGLRFEPGRPADADSLILGVLTLEWLVEPALRDFTLRYRGEATLVERSSGRRLGRAWCDRRAPTGKASSAEALADRPGLAKALQAAADSCLQQLRESLIAEATPR